MGARGIDAQLKVTCNGWQMLAPTGAAIVSAGMIAKDLKIASRAAQDPVDELGLREATGRGRYRGGAILIGVNVTRRFILYCGNRWA